MHERSPTAHQSQASRNARSRPVRPSLPTLLLAVAVAVAVAVVAPAAFAAPAGEPAGLPTAAQWAGKSPFELKPGFYRNAALRAAGASLLGAKRYDDITSRWNTAAPVQADGEALLAWSCKPHDCGDNQYATLIEGGRVMICVTEAGTSRWYLPDRKEPLAAGPAGCNFETVQDARRGLAAAQ